MSSEPSGISRVPVDFQIMVTVQDQNGEPVEMAEIRWTAHKTDATWNVIEGKDLSGSTFSNAQGRGSMSFGYNLKNDYDSMLDPWVEKASIEIYAVKNSFGRSTEFRLDPDVPTREFTVTIDFTLE